VCADAVVAAAAACEHNFALETVLKVYIVICVACFFGGVGRVVWGVNGDGG
jgi:hypothetical protein